MKRVKTKSIVNPAPIAIIIGIIIPCGIGTG